MVQVLWTGAASELEAMQLLTELALGYALALDDAGDSSGTGRQLRRRKLRGEVDRLLAATYRLVGEAVADTELRAKALPQLLGLVPSLLGLLAELAGDAAADPADEDAVHEVRSLVRGLLMGGAPSLTGFGGTAETRRPAGAAVDRADAAVPAGRAQGQRELRRTRRLAAAAGERGSVRLPLGGVATDPIPRGGRRTCGKWWPRACRFPPRR